MMEETVVRRTRRTLTKATRGILRSRFVSTITDVDDLDKLLGQWNVCVCVCVGLRQRLPSALTWAASVTLTTFQASPTSWNTVSLNAEVPETFILEG